MTDALSITDLAAGYGEKLILDGVDLSVKPGEVRVILGIRLRQVPTRSCMVCYPRVQVT